MCLKLTQANCNQATIVGHMVHVPVITKVTRLLKYQCGVKNLRLAYHRELENRKAKMVCVMEQWHHEREKNIHLFDEQETKLNDKDHRIEELEHRILRITEEWREQLRLNNVLRNQIPDSSSSIADAKSDDYLMIARLQQELKAEEFRVERLTNQLFKQGQELKEKQNSLDVHKSVLEATDIRYSVLLDDNCAKSDAIKEVKGMLQKANQRITNLEAALDASNKKGREYQDKLKHFKEMKTILQASKAEANQFAVSCKLKDKVISKLQEELAELRKTKKVSDQRIRRLIDLSTWLDPHLTVR